jgi:hypothetical protein
MLPCCLEISFFMWTDYTFATNRPLLSACLFVIVWSSSTNLKKQMCFIPTSKSLRNEPVNETLLQICIDWDLKWVL